MLYSMHTYWFGVQLKINCSEHCGAFHRSNPFAGLMLLCFLWWRRFFTHFSLIVCEALQLLFQIELNWRQEELQCTNIGNNIMSCVRS